ncbi:basic salivary proline-rich protein 2-like [Enhydra lutris kenyoni]|uniref:Basic salivary proline-rich protein 2-like n=1 Tax=Enhydra lutris kenyoni TaxID=391180 RepID=A0A2Y9JLL6_ENHLU|nr:basic salivary proline-rich protein 2-like [Enhydra lutris kenyoni]
MFTYTHRVHQRSGHLHIRRRKSLPGDLVGSSHHLDHPACTQQPPPRALLPRSRPALQWRPYTAGPPRRRPRGSQALGLTSPQPSQVSPEAHLSSGNSQDTGEPQIRQVNGGLDTTWSRQAHDSCFPSFPKNRVSQGALPTARSAPAPTRGNEPSSRRERPAAPRTGDRNGRARPELGPTLDLPRPPTRSLGARSRREKQSQARARPCRRPGPAPVGPGRLPGSLRRPRRPRRGAPASSSARRFERGAPAGRDAPASPGAAGSRGAVPQRRAQRRRTLPGRARGPAGRRLAGSNPPADGPRVFGFPALCRAPPARPENRRPQRAKTERKTRPTRRAPCLY